MGKTETKIDDLVGFLPYNCISRSALDIALTASADPIFYLEYSPTIPMEKRMATCEKYHAFASRHILSLIKGKYIDSSTLKFGAAHWKSFRALRLTQSGLYLLTGTDDPATEDRRIDACVREGMTPLSATNYFLTGKNESSETADVGTEVIKDISAIQQLPDRDSPKWKYQYERLLEESIRQNCTTLLVIENEAASTVATMPYQYTGHQYYRLWKLSNIEALFRINGFLTSVDRRPFDVAWEDDEKSPAHNGAEVKNKGNISKKEINKEINKDIEWNEENNAITFFEFCSSTIKKWYTLHPESYYFYDPLKRLSEAETIEWSKTPAFYPAHEIPGFGKEIKTENDMKASGAKNALRYNFIGLGIGKICNYLFYHTRPSKTNWSEKTERSSTAAVQLALDKHGAYLDLLGTNRTIDYAIMVCQSVQQFESLFGTWEKKMPKKWQKLRRVGAPYESMSIVTINNAGSMLLRGLMLSSPVQFEESIVNAMVQHHPEFTKSNDALYRLSYNGKPVLVAHSMDFQKLYYAWEDYKAGEEFLVSCYPEQAKYISKLMPNVSFL